MAVPMTSMIMTAVVMTDVIMPGMIMRVIVVMMMRHGARKPQPMMFRLRL